MDVREVASVEELRGAGRVVAAAWQGSFEHILPDAVLEDVAEAQTSAVGEKFDTLRERDGEAGLVVIADGEIQGFARLVWSGEYTEQYVESGDVELRMCDVDPTHQGAGVGTALLDACIDRARGLDANRFVLETFAANEQGRRFYEARGFEIVGESTFEIGGVDRETVVYARSV